MVEYLINRFSHSFSIGYLRHPLTHHSSNYSSAHDHPDVITAYISTKCILGHTAGPFPSPLSLRSTLTNGNSLCIPLTLTNTVSMMASQLMTFLYGTSLLTQVQMLSWPSKPRLSPCQSRHQVCLLHLSRFSLRLAPSWF